MTSFLSRHRLLQALSSCPIISSFSPTAAYQQHPLLMSSCHQNNLSSYDTAQDKECQVWALILQCKGQGCMPSGSSQGLWGGALVSRMASTAQCPPHRPPAQHSAVQAWLSGAAPGRCCSLGWQQALCPAGRAAAHAVRGRAPGSRGQQRRHAGAAGPAALSCAGDHCSEAPV